LILAVVLIACGDHVIVPSPSSTTPLASATATPSAPSSATPTSAVSATALGPLQGEWLLLLRRVTAPVGERYEISALSPGATAPRVLISYAPPFSPLGGLGVVTTSLSRQLSPDGKLLLLSGAFDGLAQPITALIAVELESGRTKMLPVNSGTTPLEAAWRPDGKRIAYVSATPGGDAERELWLADPDGANAIRLIDGQQGLATLYGFTPDGTWVCVSMSGYACVSTADRRVARLNGQPNGAGVVSSWRAGQPSVVATLRDGSVPGVDVADAVGASQRRLAAVACAEPRWRPHADDVLCSATTRLMLLSPGGTTRTYPIAGAHRCQERACARSR